MPSIFKRPLAEEDLIDIWSYIAEESPIQADKFLDKLQRNLEKLVVLPEMGRERPEIKKDLRSFVFKPYVIFYRKVKSGIEIIRVLHGARDIPALFQPTLH